nr:MAG TPA: hypothetical protein [Caudoviricetes sp.]
MRSIEYYLYISCMFYLPLFIILNSKQIFLKNIK